MRFGSQRGEDPVEGCQSRLQMDRMDLLLRFVRRLDSFSDLNQATTVGCQFCNDFKPFVTNNGNVEAAAVIFGRECESLHTV